MDAANAATAPALDLEEQSGAPAPAGPGSTSRRLDDKETSYMQGAAEPATSSVLISNSKYLNNPYYRDVFAQMALQRHGHDIPQTYLVPAMIRALTEVTDYAEFIALIGEEKAKNAEFGAWLDRRRSTSYEAAALRGHAPGTLGAAIRSFLEDSGMTMEFMMRGEPANDLDYVVKRRTSTHDIEHMVTGFGPNQLGEEALAICNTTANHGYFSPKLAHYMSIHSVFVSVTSYKRVSLHYPAVMPDYLDGMRRGIVAGQALKKPLFMVDWEEYLDWPIDDICADLGIERGPGAAWDYSLRAATG